MGPLRGPGSAGGGPRESRATVLGQRTLPCAKKYAVGPWRTASGFFVTHATDLPEVIEQTLLHVASLSLRPDARSQSSLETSPSVR